MDHIWAITTDSNEHWVKMTLAIFQTKDAAEKYILSFGFNLKYDEDGNGYVNTNSNYMSESGFVKGWYYKTGYDVDIQIEKLPFNKMLIDSHNE